jgi:type I restriction enzyme S subunit
MNVYDKGFVFHKLAFIDEAQANKLNNVNIEKDDVLINITGASVARCCVVPNDVLPARVNQHVSILRAKKNILNPKLLYFILISPHYKNKLLKTGEEGGATRQAITKNQLEKYIIYFPEI